MKKADPKNGAFKGIENSQSKEAVKILMQDLHTPGPDRIVFFYDHEFHAVKDGWVLPICKAEAFNLLNAGFLLWSVRMRGTDEEIPSGCPNVDCRSMILVKPDSPAEFLNLLLEYDFQTKLRAMGDSKIVSLN